MKEMLSELLKIKLPVYFTVVLLLSALLCPGILVIYLFRPDILFEQELMKQILLGCSFTFPVLLINYYCSLSMITFEDDPDLKDNKIYQQLVGGSLISLFVLYIPIAIKILFALNFRQFVWVILGLETSIIIATIIDVRVRDKQRKKLQTTNS